MIKRVILLNFYNNFYIPSIIKNGGVLSSEEVGIPATMDERTIIIPLKYWSLHLYANLEIGNSDLTN